MRFSCAHWQPSLSLYHVQGWAWQSWGQAGLNHCYVGSVKAGWSPRAGWWKNLSQSPAWRSPLFWGLGRIKGGCWWLRGFNSVTLSLIIMRQIQSSQTLTVQDGIGLSIIHGRWERSKCKGEGRSIGMWPQKPSHFNIKNWTKMVMHLNIINKILLNKPYRIPLRFYSKEAIDWPVGVLCPMESGRPFSKANKRYCPK